MIDREQETQTPEKIPLTERSVTGKDGHRDRVREKMLAGADGAQEHELLEYLLFSGIPYKDTKPIAYELLRRFGDFYGVVSASYDSLLETKGMTINAAVSLKILASVAKRYEREKNRKDAKKGADGLLQYLSGMNKPFEEACYIFKLTPEGRIKGVDAVQGVTQDTLLLSQSAVANAARASGSKNVIVVHNHPSGNVSASGPDAAYTYTLARILEASGIRLVDHVIAFGKYAYSMKNKQLYDYNGGLE